MRKDPEQPPRRSYRPKKEPPPPPRKGDCECALEIIPFDCREKTCECDGVVRSEGCGFRYDTLGNGDVVRLGYRSRARKGAGTFKTKRTAPADAPWETSGSMVCGLERCVQLERCLAVLQVSAAPRPAIKQGTGTTDVAALQAQTVTDIRNTAAPELRPRARREEYEATLECDAGEEPSCKRSTTFPVYDGDLIRLCYTYAGAKTAQAFYGFPVPADKVSFRQFTAELAENGAAALCDLYYKSATQCKRPFANYCWTACLSAVLAEDYHVVFTKGDRSDLRWRAFFALPDVELSGKGINRHRFEDRSDIFGMAHTARGVEEANRRCGSNPCCADDLANVVTTLTTAQGAILDTFQTSPSISLDIAKFLGAGPVETFRRSLVRQLIKGLDNVGQTLCSDALRVKFQ